MQETMSAALDTRGMLWVQSEPQCPAWELWNRILQTVTEQPIGAWGWMATPMHGATQPHEASTVQSDVPTQYAVTRQRRGSYTIRRNSDWPPSMTQFGGTPWKAPNKVYEYSVNGLAEEIEDFYRFIRPSAHEQMVRERVISRVRTLIIERWPDAEVDVFGSFYTGLYLPTSDIDIIVKGHWDGIPPLYDLERVLYEHRIAFPSSVRVLDKATVPLIKFQDALTNIKVDIAFNQVNCTDSARFVIRCCEVFPCLKKLAFVLKQFISGLCLNEVFHGGLSSYSLILMILSFLQLKTDKNAARDPRINLGALLMNILSYYGNEFDYDNFGIRIRAGGSLVDKAELRVSMASCTATTSSSLVGNATGMLSIEDPLTPGNDVARSSFNFNIVREKLREAFADLESIVHPVISRPFQETSPGLSILGRIIRITDAAVDERVHALQSGLWMAYPCEPALSNIYPDNTIPDLIQLYQQQSTQQQIQQQITPGTVSYCNQWVNQNGYTQFVQQPILIVGSPLVEGLGRLGSVGASEHDQQSAEDGTELPRVQEIDNAMSCDGDTGTGAPSISPKSLGRDVA
ncbi:non-canonical poly(A) RNA polymerase PAPD5-like isoform X2 [Varroa destructor]|uniref:polynucleotide adenylyltransferase n=1 Tax=Varroa destructor TaxID=109461 RepID=A0A7M7KYK5_VARDE|nr:non-canonical poly(A) RNA polymerase PAPD5-like isoform X2 [Varroa destructor]XP_022667595.1 non-canonical poly(A) RNA polymerase PAPD5-like isoform X2 [Varroa destructor]